MQRQKSRSSELHRVLGMTVAVLATMPIGYSTGWAGGDPAAGKTVFATHCAICHSANPGENKIGPSLARIAGSKSGTVPGFNFSIAMKNAGVTWSDANLDKFLTNPPGFIHGAMMFVNLPSKTDRQNVITYLNTLKK